MVRREVRAEPLIFQLHLVFEQYNRHGDESRGGTVRNFKATSLRRIPPGINPSERPRGITHILLPYGEPFQGKIRRTSLSCNLRAFRNNNVLLMERNVISRYCSDVGPGRLGGMPLETGRDQPRFWCKRG